MRDARLAEIIAERRLAQQADADRDHAAAMTAFIARQELVRQAMQGPPEPQPPGGYGRTTDLGLRALRQRAYLALRRGEALHTVRLPLP